MIEIGADEVWTPFLESINSLMLEEKKQRQDNDSFKGAEVCCKIVSHLEIVPWVLLNFCRTFFSEFG